MTTDKPATRPTHLRTHTFHGLAPGPRLLVLGAVHGNEVCGTRAITQLLEDIDKGALTIARGTVTYVPVTNPLAYQLKQRVGDRNLNRNMAPSAMLRKTMKTASPTCCARCWTRMTCCWTCIPFTPVALRL